MCKKDLRKTEFICDLFRVESTGAIRNEFALFGLVMTVNLLMSLKSHITGHYRRHVERISDRIEAVPTDSTCT